MVRGGGTDQTAAQGQLHTHVEPEHPAALAILDGQIPSPPPARPKRASSIRPASSSSPEAAAAIPVAAMLQASRDQLADDNFDLMAQFQAFLMMQQQQQQHGVPVQSQRRTSADANRRVSGFRDIASFMQRVPFQQSLQQPLSTDNQLPPGPPAKAVTVQHPATSHTLPPAAPSVTDRICEFCHTTLLSDEKVGTCCLGCSGCCADLALHQRNAPYSEEHVHSGV